MNIELKLLLSCLVAVGVMLGVNTLATVANAHGGKPHPKCKSGTHLDDNHKCVRGKK